MPHAMSMPGTGLQALILCGPGSSFPTFMSNPDENPKALLPIANRPMVWYPVEFCLRTGINNITLICPPSASQALTTAFKTNPFLTGLPLPLPDILAPAGLDQNTGTAEILRLPEVRELIKSDFAVLPCDLVCELAGDKLLQAWMVKSASLTDILATKNLSSRCHTQRSGGLGVWYSTKSASFVPVKGEETDFIATAPLPQSPTASPKGSIFSRLSKLVYSMPTVSLKDLIDGRKSFPIRNSLLRSNPRVCMHTTHRDAHIYIFPRWVVDFANANESLESIGEDVVGWLAKASWQEGLAEKLHIKTVFQDRHLDNNDPRPDGLPSPQNVGDKPDASENLPRFTAPPIVAYLHSTGEQAGLPLIRRVDTSRLLLATSLQLAKIPSVEETGAEAASPFAHAKKVAYAEGVKARTTITKQDSLIGENVTVEEKTSIKECIIGTSCQIQEGAKLSQCLLMEGVVVGKGCKLRKCILGKRCVIGDGSVLTDCEVQENLLVEARTEDKQNKLMSSKGLEATEAEIEEALKEVESVGGVAGDAAVTS